MTMTAPDNDLAARIDRLLSFARLTEFADRRAAHLSGGMQKRVGLARAIADKVGDHLTAGFFCGYFEGLRLVLADRRHRPSGRVPAGEDRGHRERDAGGGGQLRRRALRAGRTQDTLA